MSRTSSSGGCRLSNQDEIQLSVCSHLGTHLEFYHLDFVRNNWGFVALVEGGIEHLDGIVVELV